MTKIEQIEDAIDAAHQFKSKLTPECFEVGGFTSPKIRHLMNNFGAISNKYLEIGVHRGALFVATNWQNPNLTSLAVDNWSEFGSEEVKQDFSMNISKLQIWSHEEGRSDKFTGNVKFVERDCFSIDTGQYLEKEHRFDLYLYDAEHSIESQIKAITHFLPAMKDEFIMCIDDASWTDVIEGTERGLKESGVQVLFDQLLYDGNPSGDYWNGFRVLFLKK